ncbi:hypothetical protein ES703_02690 [subsurface metagenome]
MPASMLGAVDRNLYPFRFRRDQEVVFDHSILLCAFDDFTSHHKDCGVAFVFYNNGINVSVAFFLDHNEVLLQRGLKGHERLGRAGICQWVDAQVLGLNVVEDTYVGGDAVDERFVPAGCGKDKYDCC